MNYVYDSRIVSDGEHYELCIYIYDSRVVSDGEHYELCIYMTAE